jgi:hypothetical protein
MAWILMCLYEVRSCRRFTEELPFKLLHKWFLDMNPDEEGLIRRASRRTLVGCGRGTSSEQFYAEVVELAKAHGSSE